MGLDCWVCWLFFFCHQEVLKVSTILEYNKMDLNTILDQAQFLKCKAFVLWSPLEVPDVIYVMNMNVFLKDN